MQFVAQGFAENIPNPGTEERDVVKKFEFAVNIVMMQIKDKTIRRIPLATLGFGVDLISGRFNSSGGNVLGSKLECDGFFLMMTNP